MSAMVKLAKDIGQPTAECLLMAWPCERRRVRRRDELRPRRWSKRHRGVCLGVEDEAFQEKAGCMDEPRSVKDGGEDTDERVMTSHAEMCEDCEVTSLEEGHDVERVTAQNDEIVGSLKQLKDETSADLTALEKKGLDRKTNHQGLLKAETQPRLARPPPWRDKSHNSGESMLWLASSYLEHEATIQEGVKKYHLCLSSPINSLWEAINVKARSPDKFMEVSGMQVSDEDGYMTRNLTITANSKIVNVRIWMNLVMSKIVFQPLYSDTDMSKNPINGVETFMRDGRGFNMMVAHSFEMVRQKTSLSTDAFHIHPEKITEVYYAEMVEMFTSSITS